MSSPDFLHTHADTPLSEHYAIAGAICSVMTNSGQVLEAARECFATAALPERPDFTLRFWVDNADAEQSPWPKPYVRGLEQLVYAGFGEKSSILADLGRRRAIGRFSAGMAGDSAHWRMVIFPVLMTILAGSLGWIELHSSCVAKNDEGLILLGPGRSGKSTLALALTQAGFRLLSDDRTFCFLHEGKLLAYGLPRPLKLRHEAGAWFEGLSARESISVQSGERVFYCEPNRRLGLRHSRPCTPRAVILLEQKKGKGFELTRCVRREVRSSIEADLLAEDSDAIRSQQQVLNRLLGLPCWQLRYAGTPQAIAQEMQRTFFDDSKLDECEATWSRAQ